MKANQTTYNDFFKLVLLFFVVFIIFVVRRGVGCIKETEIIKKEEASGACNTGTLVDTRC